VLGLVGFHGVPGFPWFREDAGVVVRLDGGPAAFNVTPERGYPTPGDEGSVVGGAVGPLAELFGAVEDVFVGPGEKAGTAAFVTADVVSDLGVVGFVDPGAVAQGIEFFAFVPVVAGVGPILDDRVEQDWGGEIAVAVGNVQDDCTSLDAELDRDVRSLRIDRDRGCDDVQGLAVFDHLRSAELSSAKDGSSREVDLEAKLLGAVL
jgi:hypothetical protein